MAFKTVALPLLSGAALFIGYVAFSRFRRPRALAQYSDRAPGAEVEPLSSRLDQVSAEQAIDLELDRDLARDLGPVLERDVDVPQLNEHASEYASDIRALFIARVTEALSPFPGPSQVPNRVGKAS